VPKMWSAGAQTYRSMNFKNQKSHLLRVKTHEPILCKMSVRLHILSDYQTVC